MSFTIEVEEENDNLCPVIKITKWIWIKLYSTHSWPHFVTESKNTVAQLEICLVLFSAGFDIWGYLERQTKLYDICAPLSLSPTKLNLPCWEGNVEIIPLSPPSHPAILLPMSWQHWKVQGGEQLPRYLPPPHWNKDNLLAILDQNWSVTGSAICQGQIWTEGPSEK